MVASGEQQQAARGECRLLAAGIVCWRHQQQICMDIITPGYRTISLIWQHFMVAGKTTTARLVALPSSLIDSNRGNMVYRAVYARQ